MPGISSRILVSVSLSISPAVRIIPNAASTGAKGLTARDARFNPEPTFSLVACITSSETWTPLSFSESIMPSTCVATNVPPIIVPKTAIVCGLLINAIRSSCLRFDFTALSCAAVTFCIVKPSGISA